MTVSFVQIKKEISGYISILADEVYFVYLSKEGNFWGVFVSL